MPITEQYDGSAWTEVADLNTAEMGIGGAGTQTAALAFGGNGPPLNRCTQKNLGMEQVGQKWRFKYNKSKYGKRRNYNSCIMYINQETLLDTV